MGIKRHLLLEEQNFTAQAATKSVQAIQSIKVGVPALSSPLEQLAVLVVTIT